MADEAQPDLIVQNHSSIFLLEAATDRGHEWIVNYIHDEAQRWCGAVVVEHRSILDILAGAVADGLRVQRSTAHFTLTR
jgi:hypothetical protein